MNLRLYMEILSQKKKKRFSSAILKTENMVKHLPGKCKALNSNPSKNKNKKKIKTQNV
jgi:hypothetical protein